METNESVEMETEIDEISIKIQIKQENLDEEINDEPELIDIKTIPETFIGNERSDEKIPISAQRVGCTKCCEEFENKEELEIHDIIHTNENYCSLCKKIYSTRSDFISHVKSHLKLKPHKCEYCLKMFVTKKELKLHTRVHTNERPYKCIECPKAFKQLGALNDHKITHRKNMDDKKHMCELCESTFTTSSSKKRHIRRMHKEKGKPATKESSEPVELGGKLYKCEICSLQFFRRFAYYDHMRDEHADQELKCEHCGKTFTSYLALKVHIEDKHSPRICAICEAPFTTHEEFMEHQKFHFTCATCGEAFLSDLQLKRHIQTTHDIQSCKFKCEQCGKRFPTKFKMVNHSLYHTEERHFVCDICLKSFKTPSCVTKHKRHVHVGKMDTVNGTYFCTRCQADYPSLELYQQHLHIHKKPNYYACFMCNCGFHNRGSILRHVKRRHSTGGLCTHCSENFTSFNLLMDHIEVANCLLTTISARAFFKDFLCIVCAAMFKTKFDLEHHIVTNHSGRKNYFCKFCNLSYRNIMFFKKHFNKRHPEFGIDDCICDICEEFFGSEQELANHKQDVHLREVSREIEDVEIEESEFVEIKEEFKIEMVE